MFTLICAWINSWVNNREAGGWRRHHAHYDVTGMIYLERVGHFEWHHLAEKYLLETLIANIYRKDL